MTRIASIAQLPINEATRRRNPHLFGGVAAAAAQRSLIAETLNASTAPAVPAKKRIRQKTGPRTNKTEDALAAYLRRRYEGYRLVEQGLGFRLGNGCIYWPDIVVMKERTIVAIYECKGRQKISDKASVKLKWMRKEYAFPLFVMTPTDKTKTAWITQEILQ